MSSCLYKVCELITKSYLQKQTHFLSSLTFSRFYYVEICRIVGEGVEILHYSLVTGFIKYLISPLLV